MVPEVFIPQSARVAAPPPTSFAARAGAETARALIFKIDRSIGTDHIAGLPAPAPEVYIPSSARAAALPRPGSPP